MKVGFLTYNDFTSFEGDVDVQGRMLKRATESIHKQLHELEDNSKETGFNWQLSINPIPKKIYEEITGDRSTMSDTQKLETSKLERLYQILERKKQIIFYGPPGTGKTFYANELRDYILSKNSSSDSSQSTSKQDVGLITNSKNYFMINGPWEHLGHSLNNKPFLWATKGSDASDIGIYNKLQPGDIVFLSNSAKDPGPFGKKCILGFGRVVRKFEGTEPFWPDEIKENKVIYKYRFELELEKITDQVSETIEFVSGLPYTKGFNSIVNPDVFANINYKN